MTGLSKVATALTVLFAVSLAILIGDLLYVLWRRRRFLQRSVAGGDPEISGDPFYTPSKELLYFFCWKNQSRIEPATAGAAPLPPPITEEEYDVTKWQVYGPSRVLFTIKEEEKEDLESENFSYEENGTKEKRVCLKDGFEGQVLPEIAVMVEVEVEVDEATPFSTPCGSPPFYTPSPSPSRDDTESERLQRDHSLESDASFVSIDIYVK